jgi:predicted nucleic acid-binding protein
VRGQFSAAVVFLERVRRNQEVQVVYPDPELQGEAWDLFGKWGSAGANAVDCVSFAVMRQLGIRRAFTFDGHFREAGFETLGGVASLVVRIRGGRLGLLPGRRAFGAC